MKKSLLQCCALLLAVLSVVALGTLSATSASAATKPAVHHAKKHSTKHSKSKSHKKSVGKKTSKNLAAAKPAARPNMARPIMGTPDPNVDEPSEMITAIKNSAQDKFWAGKRPYPEQIKNNFAPPPPAPVFTGQIAQNELQRRGYVNDTTGSNSLRRVSYSDVSGVTFDDQPLRMNASEAFRRSLDTVSFELGRPCKSQEYLGWPMQQTEQARVDRIFEETAAKFKLRGFEVTPRKPRSVGSDVSAFTADRPDKKVLGIWSAGDVGLLLLMCDTETSQDLAYAAKQKHDTAKPAKKTKKAKKKKSRKVVKSVAPVIQTAPAPSAGATNPDAPTAAQVAPTAAQVAAPTAQEVVPAQAPLPDARPQVIPGAPPKSVPAEPAQSTPAPAAAPSAINPSSAFIPADVPAAPSMKALPPEVQKPTSDAVKDVHP